MLAEIYLLKLEAAVRATKEAATTASTSRFVPVTYRLPRRSNPAFHTARLQVYPTELQLGAMSSYSIAPPGLRAAIWVTKIARREASV